MISFVRVDDRIIHGQIITRWSKEYPCDGIIAVNDKAATTPVLKQSFVASTDKKVFVWTKEHFLEKAQTVLDSNKRYFLITKNPVDMKELLVDNKFCYRTLQRPSGRYQAGTEPVHHTGRSRSMRSDDKRWLRCILCTAGRNCYRFLAKIQI